MKRGPISLIMGVSYIELKLTTELPPSVNHYLGYRLVIKNGKAIATSHKTTEAKKYRAEFADYVREEALRQGWDRPIDKWQHFYVDAYFYFDKTIRDANNYFKVMLDAITDTQLIWVDDNVVCERVQRILYDTKRPRIELVIRPTDYIGIFDNMSQMEEFTSKCFGCTRYKRNCSILKNAKIGRIQDDVDGLVCMKRNVRRTPDGKKG